MHGTAVWLPWVSFLLALLAQPEAAGFAPGLSDLLLRSGRKLPEVRREVAVSVCNAAEPHPLQVFVYEGGKQFFPCKIPKR
ncbi:MAG: hypothetical protein HYU36_13050 [Planctomycetes bacterium]|nr:hypothetical protein [Planctomycetota bacterium]